MKSDPNFTYIQTGFGPNFREQFKALHERFPGEILLHLEWGAARAAPDADGMGFHGENVGVGGIPLVRFVSEQRLAEIIAFCREIGIGVANPHTYLLDEDGPSPSMLEKQAFKARMDPAGLLNPGKMKSFPLNPFIPSGT
jgi:hypothetical protein